jgi:hypothetical protein
MRRLVAVLALVVGGLALSGCGSRTFGGGTMCWSDPFHPCTTNTPICYGR